MSFLNTNWEHLLRQTNLTENDLEPILLKNWILSFSAGADSTLCLYLLQALQKAKPVSNRKLILYWLDHSDQTKADQDKRIRIIQDHIANINAPLSSPLDISFLAYSRDMAKIAKRQKGNFEFTSSFMRTKHLKKIFRKNPGSVVLTGHNLSDWYETFIMRINRGSSLEHLLPFFFFEENGQIPCFRPLALTARKEVREICQTHDLSYWDDPHNADESNLRAKIRHQLPPQNPAGLRLSAVNLWEKKKELQKTEKDLLLKLDKFIFTVSEGREYRIDWNHYEALNDSDRLLVRHFFFKKLGLWPLSHTLNDRSKTIPFYYKNFSVEKENWKGSLFLVFRRGQSHIKTEQSLEAFEKKNLPLAVSEPVSGQNHLVLTANLVLKKHFIQMPYGRKMVKKILSESKLSARQKKNLPLFVKPQSNEVIFIPLSVYGLRDIAGTKINQDNQ